MNTTAVCTWVRRHPPFRLALVGSALMQALAPAQPATILCPGAWDRAADAAASPPSRSSARLAYDEARERVVLFGGRIGSVPAGDTWEWDGAAWSHLADSGPAPRDQTALAYDSRRQRVVVFAGEDIDYFDFDDTWEWDGTTWQETTDADARPAQRHGHGMAYDAQRKKMVMFGGYYNLDHLLGDTWIRGGTDWRHRAGAGGPGPVMDHGAMAFDLERGITVQYLSECARVQIHQTWTFDGSTWSQATGTLPTPRWRPGMAYDSARHRVVLYGGDRCPTGVPLDTWEWDGTDWQLVATGDGPGNRAYSPGMAYDRARGRIVLFGGSAKANLDGTWTWLGPTYRCDTVIPGDINCDGIVDTDDRKIVDAARGQAACAADDTRDLDGDGRITVADRKIVESMCTFAHCARNGAATD